MPEPAAGPEGDATHPLKRRVGIDTRALSALRIAMGALILVDLFYRSLNVTAFYTDHGVFPRAALAELRPYFFGLSLNSLSGELWWQVALMVVLAIAALALVLGFRTRVATLVCLVLLGSLHGRNPFVLNSGDSLLLLLLFWGLFLPLADHGSLDARAAPRLPRLVADAASAAILLQVVIIYSMNAYFKIDAGHWVSGEAILYTFSIDRFSTPLGRLLAHAPDLLVAAGWFWLALLCVSVLLILATGRWRVVMVALFASVHLGMFLFMRLGVFPLVSLAALLPFLPPKTWDTVQLRLQAWRDRRKEHTASGADTPVMPEPPAVPMARLVRWSQSARTPLVSVLLVLLLVWSGFSLGVVAFPEPLHRNLEGHERGWAMFANPSRSNVWYVAPAVLESGQQVDALHGDETSWDSPAHVDPLYPDIRWRKYLAEFHRVEGGDLPDHFAAYLCHKWNTKDDDKITELTIYRIEQRILLDGPDPPAQARVLVEYGCG